MPKPYNSSFFFNRLQRIFINRFKKETVSLTYDDRRKNLARPRQTRHILLDPFPLERPISPPGDSGSEGR
jgi:hypothetical protein